MTAAGPRAADTGPVARQRRGARAIQVLHRDHYGAFGRRAPRSFMIPMASVQIAEVHRLHDANRTFGDTMMEEAAQEVSEHGG